MKSGSTTKAWQVSAQIPTGKVLLPVLTVVNLVSKQGLPIVPKYFPMHIQPFGHDLDIHQQKDLQSFHSRANSLPSHAALPSDWPAGKKWISEVQID